MNSNTQRFVEDDQIHTVIHRFLPQNWMVIIHGKTEPFLKGPIPIFWPHAIASLPGKSINLALAIRWLTDMNGGQPIKLTKESIRQFHISKDTFGDSIKRLDGKVLISVSSPPGQHYDRPISE
jgi:hypothetical protein